MNHCAYYHSVDIAVGVVLLAVVLRIIKLLVPLKSTQEDALAITYCTKCFKISHLRLYCVKISLLTKNS